MARPEIAVRSATPNEAEVALATIVASFLTDPIARFCWPSPHAYLQAMPAFTRAFGGRSFEHSTAFVTDDLLGAALWLPTGVEPDGEAIERVVRETVEPAHLSDMLEMFEQMEQWHPDEPHWYLPLVGVEPNAQGRGLGAALMRHAVSLSDSAGLPAYLESSNPRNISLYERHGFQVMGEIRAGAAPVMTPMLRSPKS